MTSPMLHLPPPPRPVVRVQAMPCLSAVDPADEAAELVDEADPWLVQAESKRRRADAQPAQDAAAKVSWASLAAESEEDKTMAARLEETYRETQAILAAHATEHGGRIRELWQQQQAMRRQQVAR
jgi:hypothetical protein